MTAHPFLAAAAVTAAVAAALASAIHLALRRMTSAPGTPHRGPLPPLTGEERLLAEWLREHVSALAGAIGERHLERPRALEAASEWTASRLGAIGLVPTRETLTARGLPVANLIVEFPGHRRPEEIVLVGAHYDTVPGSPGADDNASGMAALIELARRFRAPGRSFERTLRLVAFVNEENPYSRTEASGSVIHARNCRRRGDRIVAMLSVESIGCYRTGPGTQRYPFPLALYYPGRGDFVAFVGNLRSHRLLRRAVEAFRTTTAFPCHGGALPGRLPGVGWSDHWSFWQEGYPAIMLTDTVPFRNPDYHGAGDLPGTLDYERTARVTLGLARTVEALLGGASDKR